MSFVPRRSPRLAAKAVTASRPYMIISPVVDVPALRALFLKEQKEENTMTYDEAMTFYSTAADHISVVMNCMNTMKRPLLSLDLIKFFLDNIVYLARYRTMCDILRIKLTVFIALSDSSNEAYREELTNTCRDLLSIISE